MDRVTLKVNGTEYEGWTDVSITRSIERVASAFQVGFTESESDPDPLSDYPINPDDECIVLIDDEPVLTGYVDEVSASYDAGSHSLSVSGRSKTGQLVDCTALHKVCQWNNRTLAQIARELCEPFNITVIDRTESFSQVPFGVFKLENTESVFDAIERAARQRQALITDDESGNLIIINANSDVPEDHIEHGSLILSASVNRNHTDRFKEYLLKTQLNGLSGGTAALRTSNDPGVKRNYRPLVIQPEDTLKPDQLQLRIDWEATVRSARSTKINITVPGWKDRYEKLWRPNSRMFLRSPWLRLEDIYLLVEVTYSMSGERGTITEMVFAPPDAYTPGPPVI